MRRLRVVIWVMLALLAAACNLGPPQATPTVAPTTTPLPVTAVAVEPSRTPIIRFTNTPTITIEATLTPVPSETPTLTPTLTPTGTQTPTDTPSPTFTPTNTTTPSLTPSATATDTPTPTLTPSDTPTGTRTPTATPTDTFTPTHTLTPTDTYTPTHTLTPMDTATSTATQTVTPSQTPTATVTSSVTPSATWTPTQTLTSTATDTPSTTWTPSDTPTGTHTPTATPTVTPIPPTVTDTPSPTLLPTVTPIPIVDTDTPLPTLTPTPTDTPLLTITPSATFTLPPPVVFVPSPTFTLIPSATNTQLPLATSTPTLSPTPNQTATIDALIAMTRAAPTFTALPQATPTHTLIAPTLNVTPTVITATPGGNVILPTPVTLIFSTPEIEPNAPTATATPIVFPTAFPQEQIPPTIVVTTRPNAQPPLPTFNNANTSAYTFNVGPGGFTFNGTALSGSVALFAVNPVDPSSFARTDANGYLTFAPIGSGETGLGTDPFYAGFSVGSPEGNKNFVNDLAWAPNGRRFSFLVAPIEGVSGQDYQNAGVWYWDNDTYQAYPVLHDCPYDFYTSCDSSLTHLAAHWRSLDVEWSPDSTRVLITLRLRDEGRQALTIVSAVPSQTIAENFPPLRRWDNGQWLDNVHVLVSGRTEDNFNTFIGIYNAREDTYEQTLFDGNANGIAIFDAVQRPNNQLVALGRPGGLDGPLQLYRIDNGAATPISGFVGERFPDKVQWAGNYAEVVLYFGDQQVSLNAGSGAIVNATTTGAVQVNLGAAPGGQVSAGGAISIPTGVIAGSRYDAGQQIQYIGGIPRNMRLQPGLGGALADVVNPGEFVTVLAGPFVADGYEWWFVSNARNVQSWISTHSSDGGAFFNP